jgi:hypothetical protein
MAMGRFMFLRSIVFMGAVFLVSGCANMLYTPATADLNDSDISGCDRQALDDNLIKSCRRIGTGSVVASEAPFFDVVRYTTIADPYKLSRTPPTAAQFLFELTPLGIIAPLFNYPPRGIVYTGRVEFSISPAQAADRVAPKFAFRVKAGETFTKALEFNKPSREESTSLAVRYSPDSVAISIRCRDRGCTLTSSPSVVSSGGSIQLQRQ